MEQVITELKSIPLARIKADPNQPRKIFDDRSLKELTESIKKDGILSPIMVRHSAEVENFVIVYGERRFKAAIAAGLKEIPAQVRDLSDEQVFDFQITENLQRKDVHPMEEATAYKHLAEHDAKNTTQELAKRFAKSETYIVQRLSFNKLIPELQKDFFHEKLTVGHAVLLSRLSEEDQKNIFKAHHLRDDGHYRSVHNLADYINRNIIHSLDKAGFDKTDETLNPAAPACTVCPQRSGANRTLFPDIKENDRCFNPSCFAIKSAAAFIRNLTEIINTKPEVELLKYEYEDVPPLIMQHLKQHNLKPLSSGSYHTSTWKGSSYNKKAQGFHINGHQAGKFETIYLKGPTDQIDKATGKVKEKPAAELIKGIQDRQKRSKELDQEKVWKDLRPEFKAEKYSGTGDLTPVERQGVGAALLNKLDYQSAPAFRKFFKIDERSKDFPQVSGSQLNQMVRFYMFSILPPTVLYSGHDRDSLLCLNIAKQYFPEKLAAIQKAQDEVAARRIERAEARIASLKKPKADERKIPEGGTKKTTSKKAVPKSDVKKAKNGLKKKSASKKSKK